MPKKKQQQKETATERRKRRSLDERIADLQAKIAAIKEREARKQAKTDPALRHASTALKAIDKALAATDEARTRKLLEQSRTALASCLGVESAPTNGAVRHVPNGELPETLLAYLRSNPGQRGEQIATALGTDSGTIRPTMKRLIAEGKVKTKGVKRGMTYTAV